MRNGEGKLSEKASLFWVLLFIVYLFISSYCLGVCKRGRITAGLESSVTYT